MNTNPTDIAATIARELGRDPSEPGTARLAADLEKPTDPIDELPERFREAANLIAGYQPTMRSLMRSLVETAISYGRLQGAESLSRKIDKAIGVPERWEDGTPCPRCKAEVCVETREWHHTPDGEHKLPHYSIDVTCDECGDLLAHRDSRDDPSLD